MFTVVDQANTGTPSFSPLAISGIKIRIKDIRLGDCANAYNYNNRTFDCNGDLDGTAKVDKCDVCSGGKTGKVIDECLVAGIDDVSNNLINVFPNPATNILTIRNEGLTSIQITSSNGGNIAHIELNEDTAIDVSSYSPGVYYLRTTEGQTVKFIKQ